MERAGGDSLVLREGMPPHVMAGASRHDVARAVLSHNALEALVRQIFSEEARRTLTDAGSAAEVVTVPEASLVLMARVTRDADVLSIELAHHKEVAEPTATDDDSLSLAPAAAGPTDIPVSSEAPVIEHFSATHVPEMSTAFTADAEPPAWHHEAAQHAAPAPHEPPSYTAAPVFEPGNETPSFDEPDQRHAEAPTDPMNANEPESMREVAMRHEQEQQFHQAPETASMPSDDSSQVGLEGWITLAASKGATAVYLRAGSKPLARIEDRLEVLSSEVVEASAFEGFVDALSTPAAIDWKSGSGGEWTRDDATIGSVTCRLFTDDMGPGLLFRLQQRAVTTSLHRFIPRKVQGACDGDGLVVVSANSPSDVLSMGSAVADWAGRRRGGYLIALRPSGTPAYGISAHFVSQRELSGTDAEIAASIRSAASESPDVLMVAAPHSEAAMREAVHAADSGRLVIVAVMAPTSIQALRAIAGRSAAGGNAPNRLGLATAFRGAFTYRVLRRLGGGRTLVRDMILGTSEVSALLASGDFAGITRLQRSGLNGMHTIDETLARAVSRGHLSLRQAAVQAVDRRHLVNLVRVAHRSGAHRTAEGAERQRSMSFDDLFQPVGAAGGADERRRWSSSY
jgi:twitching motility protein PilT